MTYDDPPQSVKTVMKLMKYYTANVYQTSFFGSLFIFLLEDTLPTLRFPFNQLTSWDSSLPFKYTKDPARISFSSVYVYEL